MKLTSIALAATLAAAPFAANALTIIAPSSTGAAGTLDLGNCGDDSYSGIVLGDGDNNTANPYSVEFASCTTPADSQAHVTIGTNVAGTFFNLVGAWSAGETVAITDGSGALLNGEVLDIFTTFTDTTNPQSLTFSWTNSIKGAGFDYEVSIATVPLPAGVLLLGTALAGLGFARRKA